MVRPFCWIVLVAGWIALFGYGCNPTSSQNAELPGIGASPASKSDQNSPSAARAEVSGKSIWRGNSGGVEIDWTTADLFSRSGGNIEKIFQPVAEKGHEEFLADLNGATPTKGQNHNCEYRRDFEVLSIAGSLVSFQDTEYSDCGGAHPTTETRFTAVDLKREGSVPYQYGETIDVDMNQPGKVVKLTDYFQESDILNALLADPVIGEALKEAGVSTPPKTLAALPEVFAKNGYLIKGELSLRPDFLTRFAFHHLEGDMVAVRLNLPSIAFGYRSKQIGLLLPVPAVLKQPLASAASGEEGFLMGSAPQSIRKQLTRFAFKIGAGAGHDN